MLKKQIRYVDFNGVEQNETHYFNLDLNDMINLELVNDDGTARSNITLADVRNVILSSYGVKSEDGKSFVKNEVLTDSFRQSVAFSQLLEDLFTDTDQQLEFLTGIIPSNLQTKLQAVVGTTMELPSEKDVEVKVDAAPAWIRENRRPTKKEQLTMSHEELMEAFAMRLGE